MVQYQLTSATTPSTSLHDAYIASSPHSAQKCLSFCVARQCWWYRNIWLIFCTSTSSRRTRSCARRTIWISLYPSPIGVHCRMRCIVLAEPNQVWVSKCQPCLPYKSKDPGFLHDGAEPEGLAYKSVSIVLLDVDEYSVHREGQKILCTFVHHIPWREAPRPGWLGCCTHCWVTLDVEFTLYMGCYTVLTTGSSIQCQIHISQGPGQFQISDIYRLHFFS